MSKLLLMLLAGAAASAQSLAAADTSATLEDTIVVTAARNPVRLEDAPVPVTVIDAQAIARRGSMALADLLRGVAGTAVAASGGPGALTELRLDGAEANHTLVFIDGVPINDPAQGDTVDLAHLNLTGVQRIEVLHGPQSALWGSDALAGVVHLVTAAPGAEDRRRIGAGTGSFGTRDVSLDWRQSGERLYGGVHAVRLESDGVNPAVHGDEQDGYRNTVVHANAGFEGRRWRFQGVVRATDARVEFDPTPAPGFVPVDGDRESDNERELARLSVGVGTFDGRLSHTLSATRYETRNRNFADGAATTENGAVSERLILESTLDLGAGDRLEHSVVVAVEREWSDFRQRGAASAFGDPNQDQSFTQTSVIADYRALIAGRFGFSLAGRHDANDAFDDATTYRATAWYEHGNGRVGLAIGTGIKNPTFTERFGFTPDTFVGNPGLVPERARTERVWWRHDFGSAVLRASAFHTRLTDEIDGFVFDPAAGAFTAVNRDDASRRAGFDANVVFDLGERLQLKTGYAYLDATESSDAGDVDELRRARHSGHAVLDVSLPEARAHVQIGAVYTGERTDSSFATFPAARVSLEPYTLVHVSGSIRLGERLRVEARLDNVLDVRHQDVFGYETPGINARVGISLDL